MLSKIDAEILHELLQNGRTSFAEIAKKLNISKKTVWQHYLIMKQKGVIIGSTLQLNYKKIGYNNVVNIFGSLENRNLKQAIDQIQKIPKIYSVFPNDPERNLGICALLKDITELDRLRNQLRHEFNLQKIKTFSWLAIKNFPENLLLHPNQKRSFLKIQTTNRENENSKVENLDSIDRKIIKILSSNSRISINALSKKIKASQYTISKKYKNLIQKNIIKSVIQINPKILGYKAFPIFDLAFSSQVVIKNIIDYLVNIPDIIHLIMTTGDFELIVYAFVRNIEQFLEIKEKIVNMKDLMDMKIVIHNILPVWPTPNQYISTI